jgi:hypothetical protein
MPLPISMLRLTWPRDVPLATVSAQQEAPLRHGGFAFRAYADVALYASIGAFANAASHLRRVCPRGLPPRFADSVVRSIALIRERIDEETAIRLLPPSLATADECLIFFLRKAVRARLPR